MSDWRADQSTNNYPTSTDWTLSGREEGREKEAEKESGRDLRDKWMNREKAGRGRVEKPGGWRWLTGIGGVRLLVCPFRV